MYTIILHIIQIYFTPPQNIESTYSKKVICLEILQVYMVYRRQLIL